MATTGRLSMNPMQVSLLSKESGLPQPCLEEPAAVALHVRICKGEIQQWMNYSTSEVFIKIYN